MGLIDSIIGAESGGDPNASNPSSSASGLSSNMRDKFRTDTRIGELFFACRPSAILGRIVSIGILSVDGMRFGRLLAHIRQKCLETKTPSIANLDTARSIERVGYMPLILTSIDHPPPRVILGCRSTAPANRNRASVSRVGFLGCLDFVTAATKRVAGFEIGDRDSSLVAALTSTVDPSNRRISVLAKLRGGFGENQKFTERLSGIVYAGGHYGPH